MGSATGLWEQDRNPQLGELQQAPLGPAEPHRCPALTIGHLLQTDVHVWTHQSGAAVRLMSSFPGWRLWLFGCNSSMRTTSGQ